MLVARRRPKLPGDDEIAIVAANGRGDASLPGETINCLPEVAEVSELASPDK
jgi:hypothetical protein